MKPITDLRKSSSEISTIELGVLFSLSTDEDKISRRTYVSIYQYRLMGKGGPLEICAVVFSMNSPLNKLTKTINREDPKREIDKY